MGILFSLNYRSTNESLSETEQWGPALLDAIRCRKTSRLRGGMTILSPSVLSLTVRLQGQPVAATGTCRTSTTSSIPPRSGLGALHLRRRPTELHCTIGDPCPK